MANFAARLSDIGKSFSEVKILGKFAGAVGNYNADVVAYPEIDWPKMTEEFVRSLGLEFNPYVTQVIVFSLHCHFIVPYIFTSWESFFLWRYDLCQNALAV